MLGTMLIVDAKDGSFAFYYIVNLPLDCESGRFLLRIPANSLKAMACFRLYRIVLCIGAHLLLAAFDVKQ